MKLCFLTVLFPMFIFSTYITRLHLRVLFKVQDKNGSYILFAENVFIFIIL